MGCHSMDGVVDGGLPDVSGVQLVSDVGGEGSIGVGIGWLIATFYGFVELAVLIYRWWF